MLIGGGIGSLYCYLVVCFDLKLLKSVSSRALVPHNMALDLIVLKRNFKKRFIYLYIYIFIYVLFPFSGFLKCMHIICNTSGWVSGARQEFCVYY